MSRIFIEKAEEKDIFSTMREDWQRLFAESGCAPFLSWEWMSVWFKCLGGGKTPYVLKMTREDRIIGILPLCLDEQKIFRLKLRRLTFLGGDTGGADYLDLIAKPEDKREIWTEIFKFFQTDKSFDLISLENFAQNSAGVSVLQNSVEKERSSFKINNFETSVCPQVDLSKGWEIVLKNSRRRDNFKRRLKKLEKMNGFEFRSQTEQEEIQYSLERFIVLHEKRWENDGGSDATGHPKLLAFHREAVEKLAETGQIRFDEIWADGECRACIYGLDDGETFYYYNAAYDLDWAKHSVGLVLTGLSIKSAIERGNKIYDFLRGDENYKFDWADGQNELITLSLSRSKAALLQQKLTAGKILLRDFSKEFFPAEAFAKLKSIRHERNRKNKLSTVG